MNRIRVPEETENTAHIHRHTHLKRQQPITHFNKEHQTVDIST